MVKVDNLNSRTWMNIDRRLSQMMRKETKMRRLALLLASVGAMLAVFVGVASAEAAPGETLDANNLNQSPILGNAVSPTFVNGQTFTTEHAGTLTSVEVPLARMTADPLEDLTVQIANVDATTGLPTIPEDILATAKLPASEVPQIFGTDSFVIEKITFDAPASVVAGKKYALILKLERTLPTTNFYVLGTGEYLSDSYTGGERIFRVSQFDPQNTLGPWSRDEQPFDLIFGVYVTSPLDTTSPKVDAVKPAEDAEDVTRTTNVTATFSERMDPSTLNTSTFKLFKVNKSGTTSRIADAPVRLSADGLRARLNPFGASTSELAPNTRYKAVVTAGAKDLAGNRLDQNSSADGSQPMVWYFSTGRS